MSDDFYIGWEARAGGRVRRRMLALAFGLLALALAAGAGLAAAQKLIGHSVFEFGAVKTFSGIFEARPCPHLLVRRPGVTPPGGRFSSYYLVAEWKFGLPAAVARAFDGQAVSLRGTLIYRDNATMIQVEDHSIAATGAAAPQAEEAVVDLGRQTLIGEIVDSKCYFGVMNPGRLTPHRGCAIRCISGGIPPVLLVRRGQGPAWYVLLVSQTGEPVNQQVLDYVAEPVAITGELQRQDGLLVLRADPSGYQRIPR